MPTNNNKKASKKPPTDPTRRRSPPQELKTIKQQKNGPYLSNTMTASSLSDSQYQGQFALSSDSSSSSSQSQTISRTEANDISTAKHQQKQAQQQMLQPNHHHHSSYVSSTGSSVHNQSNNSQSTSSSQGQGQGQKLYYTSPRIELEDRQIFPTSPRKVKALQKADDRWQNMSQQAGSHKQDSTVLHFVNRGMTPPVLKAGVPPQVANRIQELHLRLDDHQAEDTLPEWLDVISQKFPQLERLFLGANDDKKSKSKKKQDATTQPNRLRRLYILYRIPHLQEIDGVAVTRSERRLARPDDPNGHRVSKSEWCHLGEDDNNKEEVIEEEGVEIGEDRTPITPSQKTKQKKKRERQKDDKQNDDNDEDDDRLQMEAASLIQAIASDSEEGYELDLDLADAIQRIKGPSARSLSPQSRTQPVAAKPSSSHNSNNRHRDDNNNRHSLDNKYNNNKYEKDDRKGKKTRALSSPPSKNKNQKQSNNKSKSRGARLSPNKAARDRHDDHSLEYVECDSTVTSEYGYGHWSRACFAPFQVCTIPTRRKTKQAFVARKHASDKQQHQQQEYHRHGSSLDDTREGNRRSRKHNKHDDDDDDDDDDSSQDESDTGSTTQPTVNAYVQPASVEPKKYHPDPPVDQVLSPNPKPSSKYSSLVDETVQKEELKHRRKLFRDSTASQGCSTAHTSRKSHKYSRLLVEMEDEHEQQQQQQQNESPPRKDKTTASKPSSPKDKKKKVPVIPLEEDDTGTMTGVSIEVARGANAGMSVATIPTVLRREAEKLQTSKQKESSENLAARRNMTGVTIDVPPPTPQNAKTTKEPKLKQAPNKSPKQKQSKKAQQQQQQQQSKKESEKKEQPPRNLKEIDTETFEAMDDPDIVDMVMNKLGNNKSNNIQMSPSLQLPHLTTTPTVTNKGTSDENRGTGSEEASVSSEAQNAKILNKVKRKKQRKANADEDHEPPSADNSSQDNTGTTEGSARSKENLNDLELRLNTLIAGNSRLKEAMTPMSDKDRKIMAETVNKLDENLKNILEQQLISSPEKRATPTRSRRRQGRKSNTDDDERANMTDASPLSKLENSMGQLFSTIMAQMSPAKRALGSPSTQHHVALQKKKEKQQQEDFFSKETEKTLKKLEPTTKPPKLDDDDSTLFVVEIEKDEVAESLTNVDFRQGRDKIVTEAPSVINLVEPSVQSSVTGYVSKQYVPTGMTLGWSNNDIITPRLQNTNAGPPALPSLSHLQQNAYINGRIGQPQHPEEERDPTVIDLTDKSTVVTFRPPNPANGQAKENGAAINHLDSQGQQMGQAQQQQQQQQQPTHQIPMQNQNYVQAQQPQTPLMQYQQYPQNQYQMPGQIFNQQFSAPSQPHAEAQQQSMQNQQYSQAQQQPQQNQPFQQQAQPSMQHQAYQQTQQYNESPLAQHPPLQTPNPNHPDKKEQTQPEQHQNQSATPQPIAQQPNLTDHRIQQPAIQHQQAEQRQSYSLTEKYSSSGTAIETGGNASCLSHPGSKLGMVLNLATINENDAAGDSNAGAEVDGQYVAAAAAGAAAGAEAEGDDDEDDGVAPDCPSEFIPTDMALHGGAVDPRSLVRPPSEIATKPAVNPIMAVLQTPIVSAKDEFSSGDANPYPKEVLVARDAESVNSTAKEPAFIATLLSTTNRLKSNLSLASRKDFLSATQSTLEDTLRTPHGTKLPKEIIAMVYEAMSRVPQDDYDLPGDLPSPKKSPRQQLPREILALLEERQGIGPSLSEEARAMLPYEFASMLDEAYKYCQSPGGPPREIMGVPDSPAESEGFPQSLPREVRALQIPDPPCEGARGVADLPPTPANQPQASPSNYGRNRLQHLRSKTRFPKPFGSISSQSIKSGEVRTGDANFRGDEDDIGNGESQDSNDLRSLPSNVVVNHGSSNASPSHKVPPSRSLTSPFPMQFRERMGKPTANQYSKHHSTDAAAANVSTTTETQAMSRTGTSKQRYGYAPPSESSSNFPMKHIHMETIASPTSREETISPQQRAAANKAKLPPPCPSSTRRPIASISPRSEKMKKALLRYKDKRSSVSSARSNSIMDGVDEDEEEVEEYYDSYEQGEAFSTE